MYEIFIQAAEKVGLGIAMSGLMAVMFFYFLRKTIDRHDKDISVFADITKNKDITLNNHIDHLREATLLLKDAFLVHDAKVEFQSKQLDAVGDKIVAAIDSQSDLMKEIARDNGEKHDKV